MPQSDNTLGAPTEGLGQKVTFAFDPAAPVPAQGGNYGQLRVGVQGGDVGNTNIQHARPATTETHPIVGLLMSVADAKTKQDMKERQTNAYLRGMQRAAQGESVADIAKENPWYANIFGPSDVVEGARAYAVATKANTTLSAMRDNMDVLRTLTPEDAQRHYQETVKSAMTGDSVTDAQTMIHLTQELPVLEKQRLKEHYGYVQEQATTAEAAYFRSGFTLLQDKAKARVSGTITEEEFTDAQNNFEASLQPAAGRNIKGWQASMKTLLVEEAQKGNFIGLNALRRQDVGLLDALGPDAKTDVEAAVQRGETNLRTKYSDAWSDDLAILKITAANPEQGTNTEALGVRIDALNAKYRSETGSAQNLIPPGEKAAMLTRSAEEIIRAKQRNAAELESRRRHAELLADNERTRQEGRRALKEAEQQKEAAIIQAVNMGEMGVVSHWLGKDESNRTEYRYIAGKGDGTGILSKDQITLMARNTGTDHVNPILQDSLQGKVNRQLGNDVITEQFRGEVENYRNLYAANPATAKAYYGPLAPKMERFIRDVDGKLDEASAYRNNFILASKPPEFNAKAHAAAVEATGATGFMSYMSSDRLKPGQASVLVNELHDIASEYAKDGDLGYAYKSAWEAKRNVPGGVENIGGYIIPIGKNQRPLAEVLTHTAGPNGERPIATDKPGESFADAVASVLMKKGDEVYTSNDLRDVRLVRIDSGGGEPVLLVYGQAPDGGKLNGVLYTSEIYKEAERGRKLRAGPKYKRIWGESLEVPERSGPVSPNTSLLGRYLRE